MAKHSVPSDDSAGFDVASPDFGWPEVRELPPGPALTNLLDSRSADSLDDAELIDALAAHRRLANSHEARALELAGELDARRTSEPRHCRNGFDMSARRQTTTEVGAALREGEFRAKHLLKVAKLLRDRLRRTADLFAAGRISLEQATTVADQIARLRDPGLTGEVETRILERITTDNAGDVELAAATATQTRLSAKRVVAEAEPGQHEWRRKLAHAARGLHQWSGEDGVGTLTLRHSSPDLEAVYHRFGMLARSQYCADDPRTLQQQVADLVLAVLRGDVEPVNATAPTSDTDRPVSTSELEDGAEVEVRPVRYRGARAQINITLTAAAAMGLSDQPGVLQSGAVIPASLARQIAYQPDSTWYRLLTDESGRMIELSAKGYRPPAPLSRTVRAEHMTCTQAGCLRPADFNEDDHNIPWPAGQTARHNLHPPCKPHHQGKTTGHFHTVKHPDGTVTWRYPTGHTYSKSPTRHPVDTWCGDWIEPESMQQIQDGLAALHRERDRSAQLIIDNIRQHIRDRQLAAMLDGWRRQTPEDEALADPPDPDHPDLDVEEYDALCDALVAM